MSDTSRTVSLPEASVAVTVSVCGHGASEVEMRKPPRRSGSTGPMPSTSTMDPGSAEPLIDAGNGQIGVMNGESTSSDGPTPSVDSPPRTFAGCTPAACWPR